MELYGRDAELGVVAQRLRERRLVTVVGTGGIGKTALAGTAAELIGPELSLGAVHVDLTRVDRPEGVAEAVASQLGYADFPSLLDSPGDQPVLLVVDNCEHVLDAAATTIEGILGGCAMPRVLATSRTALDVDGESILSLGPLPSPAGADRESPSLRLFVARARDHGVELGELDLEVAAEICRRLDGVPLAIELAAARLRMVGLVELAAELENAPHALARRRHRGQASHRSVGDLIGWSYELLDPVEQAVFRSLGVFAGPFTRDTARRVVNVDAGVLDVALDGLIAASLVAIDRSTEATRYRLLHPVRAVSLDLLERDGQADAHRSRLVDAICDQALAIVRGGPDGSDPAHVHLLIDTYDDVAGSIRWLLDHDVEPDRALTLVAMLWGIVHNAHSREIHELGKAVLARWPDPSARHWPHAVATVSTCRLLAGDPRGAIELAEGALPHAERSSVAPAVLRRVIAHSRRAAGDIAGARAMFHEGAERAAAGAAWGLFFALTVDEGLALVECGEIESGLALIERMAEETEVAGALINAVWAAAARASVLLRVGDPQASASIEAALRTAREIAYPAGVTFALRLSAADRIETGDCASAAASLLELLDSLLQRGGLDELRVVLDLTAELMRRDGDDRWVDIATTAAEFPITSFITPTALAYLPDERPGGRRLSTREAYSLAREALRRLAEPTPSVADVPIPPPDGPSMLAEGDVWSLTFEGSSVRIKRSKGLDDLAVLLAAPDREVSVLDLAGTPAAAGASEDELVDPTARRQYEQRIRDLQSDIDDAEANHDSARSALLQAEFDALVEHLAAAVGVGGRTRRTTGTTERARSAVTQRIRSTIRHIEEVHPSLGAHLRRTVSTGTFCRYAPDPRVDWTIRRDR